MNFSWSTVEDAALGWFGDLDYAVLHGPEIAPGEAAAERNSFSEAFLPERLRAALRKLNPKLPAEALEDAFRKITLPQHPSLIATRELVKKSLAA
jgi:type I restriction enzyme R subunit